MIDRWTLICARKKEQEDEKKRANSVGNLIKRTRI